MNLILLFFFSVVCISAENGSRQKNISEFFKDKTKISNPLSLRDPFKSPVTRGPKVSKNKTIQSSGSTLYSNISIRPSESLSISDIKVVGVLIGKERRVLVNANPQSKDVIVLKEGMKIGQEGAELKAILPGGIVLVEKIVNVYGEEEFLETVIPISRQ